MNFHIKTFGCQMNTSDSEKMRTLLESQEMHWTDDVESADLIVVNSCAVRQKPQEKIFSYIGRFPPSQKVILAGCVAQLEREKSFSRKRKPDFIVGTQQYVKIAEIAKSLFEKGIKRSALSFTRRWHELVPDFQARSSPVTAFVSIMEGCNNFCSFCVVPFARGREKHRPFDNIMKEAELLSRKGFQEIILLGQNVNAWKDNNEKISFPQLLRALATQTDIRWIRFITSYPGYHDPALVEAMACCRNLARHIHLPAQSGSSRILRLMNRNYSRSRYLQIVHEFRRAIPQMDFSSDFIVGFPGETEKDFNQTLSLVESIGFESIFSFIYSPRKSTRAFLLNDDFPQEKKKERLYRLHDLQERIQTARNRTYLGRTIEVLITQRNPKKPHEAIGRTESYRVVNISSNILPGQFCRVKITSVGPHSMRGEEIAPFAPEQDPIRRKS